MFKSAVNYFQNQGTKNTYPKICKVNDWVELSPQCTIPKQLKEFVSKKMVYTLIDRNYQKEIQGVLCLTPEKIYKSGIDVKADNVVYQKEDLNKLNATDLNKSVAKEVVKQAIKNAAISEADKDIQNRLKQLEKEKQELLKKGENK